MATDTVSFSVSNETKQPVCSVRSFVLEDLEPPPEPPLHVQPNLPEILCTEVHAVESPASQFATGPEDNAAVAAILLLSASRKTTTGREEEGIRKTFFFFSAVNVSPESYRKTGFHFKFE